MDLYLALDCNLNIIQRSLVPIAAFLDGSNQTLASTSAPSASGVKKAKLNTAFSPSGMSEFRASLICDHENQLAAAKLASLFWVMAHEMSLEDYGVVELQVFTEAFGLIHSTNKQRCMAGPATLDVVLAAPSADEEKKPSSLLIRCPMDYGQCMGTMNSCQLSCEPWDIWQHAQPTLTW